MRARVPRWDLTDGRKGRNVIKKLKRILGLALGPSEYSPNPSVIGEVEQSPAGNAVLRIGKATVTDVDHPSWTQTEYVVLNSEERDELIGTLVSQQGYQTIKVGDIVSSRGAIVLAVHYANGAGGGDRRIGTVLAWDDFKREYIVWTADPYGDVANGTYTFDQQKALNAYIARLNDHLFRHFNAKPPAITYAHVAERDTLKGDRA
ncbi:hypothetical protein SEA_KRADAL_316 [Streptomyces phage Kradal]|nr:hypothetical protein SEA_KRADAL_316 [Streptomyces phage Kradal]